MTWSPRATCSAPTRTEGPSGTLVTGGAPVVKPNLFGVVVRDNGSITYLEDPTTKRVAGYRVGDCPASRPRP